MIVSFSLDLFAHSVAATYKVKYRGGKWNSSKKGQKMRKEGKNEDEGDKRKRAKKERRKTGKGKKRRRREKKEKKKEEGEKKKKGSTHVHLIKWWSLYKLCGLSRSWTKSSWPNQADHPVVKYLNRFSSKIVLE